MQRHAEVPAGKRGGDHLLPRRVEDQCHLDGEGSGWVGTLKTGGFELGEKGREGWLELDKIIVY